MHYCRRCLVYIDEKVDCCPLCQGLLIAIGEKKTVEPMFSTGRLAKAEDQENFWIEYKKTDSITIRKRVFGFYTIANITAILILVGINISHYDQLNNKNFSYIPNISLLCAYILTTTFYYIKNRAIASWLIGLIISGFFIALDASDHQLTWAFSKAIPIAWACILPIVLPLTAWGFSRIKGYNVIAWFSSSIGLSLLLIDLALSAERATLLRGWSIISLGVSLSCTILFFYMHYILKMHLYLDQTFHVVRRTKG